MDFWFCIFFYCFPSISSPYSIGFNLPTACNRNRNDQKEVSSVKVEVDQPYQTGSLVGWIVERVLLNREVEDASEALADCCLGCIRRVNVVRH